ncbi:MAG: hypothetical protein ACOCU2_00805 [Bacillota bacterium]
MRNMLAIVALIFLFIFNYFIVINHIEERHEDTEIAVYKTVYEKDDTIYQVVSTDPGKHLVPKGSILGANDIDHINYSYTINIENHTDFNEDTIDIALISDVSPTVNVNHLFDTEIEVSIDDGATQAVITVSVYLNAIETQEDYEILTSQAINLSMELDIN